MQKSTSIGTILLPREKRKFSKSCCCMKKNLCLHQQTYPVFRKNSAFRVSLFYFRQAFPLKITAFLTQFSTMSPKFRTFAQILRVSQTIEF